MFNTQAQPTAPKVTTILVGGNCHPIENLTPSAVEALAREKGIGAFNLLTQEGREILPENLGNYVGQVIKIEPALKAQ